MKWVKGNKASNEVLVLCPALPSQREEGFAESHFHLSASRFLSCKGLTVDI